MKYSRIESILFAVLFALLLAYPVAANAMSTGVSDDRVSLPEGPGSLEGVGENVDINPSMGMMNYSVPIKVPKGYKNMTPGLSLSYSSGAGSSIVGIGWSLPMMSIERATVYGLPKYDADDNFAANGSSLLVRIPNTDPPIYRERFEGSFVRYTWHDVGDGSEGYWTAEYPDGRIGYFGADADGNLVDTARLSGEKGTFRYYLVDMTDRFGHKIRYNYQHTGTAIIPASIEWVFAGDGGAPLYKVTFEYEDRNDKISDCKPGFNELLDKRLTKINIYSHGQIIRYYELRYEDYSTSGGFSRLSEVQFYGLNGTPYPISQRFEYSKALGADCSGEDCSRPYMVDMGSLGVDIRSGDTNLIDINGDSLPDVIDTSMSGQPHRFFINKMDPDGSTHFEPAFESAVGNAGSFDLSSPYVQVMDVDGDGFTDLINTQSGQVLHNLGTGDWAEVYSLWSNGDGGVPDLNGDFDNSDGELRTIRFMDYDGDKKIDLIRSIGGGDSNTTTIYRNLGNGGFQSDPNVEPIGAGFESDSLELDDMNGDGLLDPVQVLRSEVRYRLNLGWGHWSDWIVIHGFNFTDQQAIEAEMEDLNGDALADIVLVTGNEVHYWINRNGASFDPERIITSDDINGEIPVRDSNMTVLYADMNGNGSSDIVWIDSSGHVKYLELFPNRPNLISSITNGLGRHIKIEYGTAAQHLAKDTSAWKYALPTQINVVNSMDEWDELNQLHNEIFYTYHDGFYDGIEKQFRGFERVEQYFPGDDTGEDAWIVETYDVGKEDPYHNGLLLTQEFQGANHRSISYMTYEYGDCPLAGIPETGLKYPVRFICQLSERKEIREGLDASQWITTEIHYEYNGYGRQTMRANLGVVSIGGGACQSCSEVPGFGHPCGPQCLGDEQYMVTEYATPETNDGRWLLDFAISKRVYGSADADGNPADDFYMEAKTYYDGDAFVGLPWGKVEKGAAVRIEKRKNESGEFVTIARKRIDQHGNVVESIDALGEIGGNTHRRIWTMDDAGLHVIRTDIALEDEEGPYLLRREYQYDNIWGNVIEASSWMLVRGGSSQTPRNSMFYTYDEFGRLVAISLPGDATTNSLEITYELGSPNSRTIVRSRSRRDGELDVEKIICYDGFGRRYQQRQKVGDNKYVVSGFVIRNTKGDKYKVYQNYESDSPECDDAPPAGVGAISNVYDAVGRLVQQIFPATSDDLEPPTTRIEYLPLVQKKYDKEDTNEDGPYANTPEIYRKNGIGLTITHEFMLTSGGEPLVYSYIYDGLGNLTGWIDPAGNKHTQKYDLLGNVIEVDDPDRGQVLFEYDAKGNVVREEYANGRVVRRTYDGDNRLLEIWEEGNKDATLVVNHYDTPLEGCGLDKCTNVVGRLSGVTYPLDTGEIGKDFIGYDLRGNIIYTGRNIDGHLFEVRSEYDNLSRPLKNTYPNGLEIAFELDGMGRVVSIPGYIDRVKFEPRGFMSEIYYHNGVTTTRVHDERMRLVQLNTVDADSKPIQAYTYIRDRVGNVVEILDGREDDGHPMGGARYTYDALYRLTKAELDPDRPEFAETIDITYDEIGNILSKVSSKGEESEAHVGNYIYGNGTNAGPHAVVKAGDVEFEYDAAGNITRRGDETFEWDYFGRMVRAVNDGHESVFVYGSGSDRIIKREDGINTYFISDDFEVRNGKAVVYVRIDGERMVKIEDPSYATKVLSDIAPITGDDSSIEPQPDDAITAADAWVAQAVKSGIFTMQGDQAVSNVEALLEASITRMLDGTEKKVRYLHKDHIGGTVAVTDEEGKLVERTEYYPYGLTRYESSNEPVYYGYTGKELDRSTGLIYFGARYLDPWTGRWTAPDPTFTVVDKKAITYPVDGTGAYPYSRNNPVNIVDHRGEWGVLSIVGAVVGGVTAAAATLSKQIAHGQWKNSSWKKKLWLGTKVLAWGAFGAVTGALTGGLGAAKLVGAAKGLAIAGIAVQGVTNAIDAVSGYFGYKKVLKSDSADVKVATAAAGAISSAGFSLGAIGMGIAKLASGNWLGALGSGLSAAKSLWFARSSYKKASERANIIYRASQVKTAVLGGEVRTNLQTQEEKFIAVAGHKGLEILAEIKQQQAKAKQEKITAAAKKVAKAARKRK